MTVPPETSSLMVHLAPGSCLSEFAGKSTATNLSTWIPTWWWWWNGWWYVTLNIVIRKTMSLTMMMLVIVKLMIMTGNDHNHLPPIFGRLVFFSIKWSLIIPAHHIGQNNGQLNLSKGWIWQRQWWQRWKIILSTINWVRWLSRRKIFEEDNDDGNLVIPPSWMLQLARFPSKLNTQIIGMVFFNRLW